MIRGALCFFAVLPIFAQTAARDALIKQADQALSIPAASVMDKKAMPPSGNKHDYMSVGPYWWPDPAKPDGLPYIRKDGEQNPQRNDDNTDNNTFKRLLGAVPTLALAYRETGREEYAQHAAKLLRVWFLDPATKMNPNLDYGQAIPGRVDGRGIGIIDTAGLLEVTQALPWLAKSAAWPESDQGAMRAWLADYLKWLQTSKNGREEAEEKNNHGTWYDVQVTALAVYTGARDLARRVVEIAKEKRIAAQIEPDGKMPLELARTNSLSYSTMNLRAFMNLADLAKQVDVDLWHFQTKDGRGIRKALDFLAPYSDPSKKWEFEQISNVKVSDRMNVAQLLRRGSIAYHEPLYQAMLAKLPAKNWQATGCRFCGLFRLTNNVRKRLVSSALPGHNRIVELEKTVCDRARLARDARFDGRFFTAVKSTKIYCRPICPAPSPKASNVIYFPSAAAAAEAGFRPCLRCRPEASPGTPAWLGTSTSVSRALKLIGEGALDEGSVDDLAERLGLGSRHLRRMFLQHLGATPVAVAQTRRVHFAKKLIDETNLPMTQVAMSAGFASIRRFNATFQNLYGRTPGELRRAGQRGRNGHQAGVYTFKLGYRPPYDWDSLIGFLMPRATPGVETVTPEEYRRTISFDGKAGAVSVRPVFSKNYLELQIEFPEPSALFRIIERVRNIFDLRADPSDVDSHLKNDPQLKPIVRAHSGIRVPGCWDGFEIAVRAILGQQVSVKAATTMAGRLASAFGAEYRGARLFPTADSLADADLAKIGLTKQRAHSIRELASAVAHGKISLDASGGPEQFEESLTGLPGIGPWTAQYIAMRLGEPDAFPLGDLYLQKFARESEAWRPWRAYAAMYIWRSHS